MLDPNFPQDVAEFHEAAGQPHGQAPRLLDGRLPYEKLIQYLQAAYVLTKLPSESEGEEALRVGLIIEEVVELVEALRDRDLVLQLDAQLDIVYVTLGMGVAQGLPLNLGWEEVHRTNMNKVRGGTIYIGGKIVKPAGWTGPEEKLDELIRRMQWVKQAPRYVEGEVVFGDTTEGVSPPPVFDVEVLPPEVTPEVTPEQENHDGTSNQQADGEDGESPAGGGLYGKW